MNLCDTDRTCHYKYQVDVKVIHPIILVSVRTLLWYMAMIRNGDSLSYDVILEDVFREWSRLSPSYTGEMM